MIDCTISGNSLLSESAINECLAEAEKLARSRQFGEAIQLLLPLLQHRPKEVRVLGALGKLYQRKGQPDLAIVFLERLLSFRQALRKPTQASQTRSKDFDSFDEIDILYVEDQAIAEEEILFEYEDVSDLESEEVGYISPSRNTSLLIDNLENEEFSDGSVYLDKTKVADYQRGEEVERAGDDIIAEESSYEFDGFEEYTDEYLQQDSELPQESEESAWNELDFIEEYRPNATKFDAVEVDGTVQISREIRARQKAAEVIAEFDWDVDQIDLVQQIFVENGWGQTRKAIGYHLARNVHPMELALARDLRLRWEQCDHYWACFRDLHGSNRGQQSSARYQRLSWVGAFRIIACFPLLPDIEELANFLEFEYQHWYSSQSLLRVYPNYSLYLDHRTGTVDQTLPGTFENSFFAYEEEDEFIGFDELSSPLSPTRYFLHDLGISCAGVLRNPPNIMWLDQ